MTFRITKNSKILTITIHVLVWLGLFMLPFLDENHQHFNSPFIYRIGFDYVLFAVFFYMNAYFLIPRYFLAKKIEKYILIIVACIPAVFLIKFAYAEILHHYILNDNRPPFNLARMFYGSLFPSLFVLALSTTMRITNEWFKTEKQKKEMENEKLISELAFLKSQVNPHFLFNILNNICSLARKKSDHTEDAIIKLSQIMRYMLYESKDEKVSLEKEVEYLQNYIELQRLRISDSVAISFQIEGRPETRMIEPMLLIPFVENAFKHGISYLEESRIEINLRINQDTIWFRVVNNVVKRPADAIYVESGIGLKNVLRRLDLLYPSAHDIKIQEDGVTYLAELTIKRTES